MTLILSHTIYSRLTAHLQAAYPNEGAGLLLGPSTGLSGSVPKRATAEMLFPNRFEAGEQHHRYLITAEDMLAGEAEAERRGLEIIGIFHSHPDHPAQASEYDREYALPWYCYLIVSVQKGLPVDARVWTLTDDRSRFLETAFTIEEP